MYGRQCFGLEYKYYAALYDKKCVIIHITSEAKANDSTE